MKTLVAIPVYNEQKHIARVIGEVTKYARDILVIDDGSSDDTPSLLAKQPVDVIRHAKNRGYGRSLRDAFRWVNCYGFDWLITMDCDEQHEPAALPRFYEATKQPGIDVVSGSRYLKTDLHNDLPPIDRRAINAQITELVNNCLGYSITDAFCGYKAFRVSAVKTLPLDEDGYAFPLQFWVQAAAHKLSITELPVRLIYNDPNRTFGGPLDDAEVRLKYYRHVFSRELKRWENQLAVPETCGCGAA